MSKAGNATVDLSIPGRRARQTKRSRRWKRDILSTLEKKPLITTLKPKLI
jgi:hypothetical protein